MMSPNRRKNANLLPVAKIITATMVLLTIGGGALYYVDAKNELHRCGQRKKELERELLAISTRDEVVTSRIAKMSSFDSLRKRQIIDKEAFVHLGCADARAECSARGDAGSDGIQLETKSLNGSLIQKTRFVAWGFNGPRVYRVFVETAGFAGQSR